jgi:hypothetical protein
MKVINMDIFASLAKKQANAAERHASSASAKTDQKAHAIKMKQAEEEKRKAAVAHVNRDALFEGLQNVSSFDKIKRITSGSFSPDADFETVLSQSYLRIDNFDVKLPADCSTLDKIVLHLRRKRKGKSKKILEEEEMSRVRQVDRSEVSFNLPNGDSVDDQWYEYIHAQAVQALKELRVPEGFMKQLAAPPAASALSSELYNVQVELSDAFVSSSGCSQKSVNGFETVRGGLFNPFNFAIFSHNLI